MLKKILLADDSITIQKVISITFSNEDYQLEIAGDGTEAISTARDLKPDLVLVDVAMPGKNGYEIFEAVKADPELKGTPVMLLAGTFEPLDKAEAERVRADDYIVKPFESQDLIDKVKALLAGSGRTEAPAPAAVAPPQAEAPEIPEPPLDISDDIWDDGEIPGFSDDFGEKSGSDIAAEGSEPSFDLEFTSGEERQSEAESAPSNFVDLDFSDEELKPGDKAGGLSSDLSEESFGFDIETPERDEAPADSGLESTFEETQPATEELPGVESFGGETDEAIEDFGGDVIDATGEVIFGETNSVPEAAIETTPEPFGEVTAETPQAAASEVSAPEETQPLRLVTEDSEAAKKLEEKAVKAITEKLQGKVDLPKEKLEQIVSRVAREIVEEIAWDVVPELAEDIISKELEKVREAFGKLK